MLNRVLVAAMIMGFVSNTAFGAPAKAKNASKATKVEADDDDTDDDEAGGDGSASIRTGKPMGVALLYTPLSDFVLQFGLGGTFTMDSSIQLGFDFLMGGESIADKIPAEGNIEVTKLDLDGMAIYGYGRYFFGDTFNVKAGLGYRSAKMTYKITDTSTDEYISGDLSISSIILPIAIGNHWVWDSGLTLGVDWATVMVAISGSSEGTTETNFEDAGGLIEDINNDTVDLGDELAHQSTLTLALVSLGYIF